MSANRKKIIAISGSTRTNSSNEAILKLIKKMYAEHLEITIYTEIATLPHFNPDLNNENVPVSIQHFRTLITQADGVIICTPEYIFSLPGTLKNAIEWCVSTTIFSKKPTALIVASSLGEKAYESLQLIMNTLEAKIGNQSTLLMKGAKSKLNEQSQLTDRNTLEELKTLMNSFEKSLL